MLFFFIDIKDTALKLLKGRIKLQIIMLYICNTNMHVQWATQCDRKLIA